MSLGRRKEPGNDASVDYISRALKQGCGLKLFECEPKGRSISRGQSMVARKY